MRHPMPHSKSKNFAQSASSRAYGVSRGPMLPRLRANFGRQTIPFSSTFVHDEIEAQIGDT